MTREIFFRALLSFLCCISTAYCEAIDFKKACSPKSSLTLTAEEGDIYSPGFKENKKYPLNINCTFILDLKNRPNVLIEVEFMDLEKSNCVYTDNVQIFFKINKKKRLERMYCGSDVTDRIFLDSNKSENRSIIIKFKSDSVISGRGFLLHYKYTNKTSLCRESEMMCRNSHCVPKSAICNLKDDCGDGTDEENCEKRLKQDVECGTTFVEPDLPVRIESRIVGGQEAVPGSWPWQADLQISFILPNGHTCGGSLINSLWVATAVHCLTNQKADALRVHLGNHDKYRKNQYEQIRYVKSIHVPDYRALNGTYQDMLDNDFALLRLSAEVEYNDHVRPVCLPPQDFQIKTGTICYTSGWGRSRGSGFSSVLKQTPVKILETCKSAPDHIVKPETMICTGGHTGGACNGDSGGPLVCQMDERWFLIGVTSFEPVETESVLCGAEGAPVVYQKVSVHIKWLEDIIKEDK